MERLADLREPQSDLARQTLKDPYVFDFLNLHEDAGKMNFYLSNVDDNLRHRDDRPSIGLIFCKHRDRIIAEYALRDMGHWKRPDKRVR